jgi:hypothetical protein
MSSPHTANDHVKGMVCRVWAGRLILRAYNWHPSQVRTTSLASATALGQ